MNDFTNEELEQLKDMQKKRQDQMEFQAQFDTMQGQSFNPYQRQEQSPREYLQSYLLQAKQVGCNVDNYIDAEIKKMLNELER